MHRDLGEMERNRVKCRNYQKSPKKCIADPEEFWLAVGKAGVFSMPSAVSTPPKRRIRAKTMTSASSSRKSALKKPELARRVEKGKHHKKEKELENELAQAAASFEVPTKVKKQKKEDRKVKDTVKDTESTIVKPKVVEQAAKKEVKKKEKKNKGRKEDKEIKVKEEKEADEKKKKKDPPIKFQPAIKDQIGHIFQTPDRKTRVEKSPPVEPPLQPKTAQERAEAKLRELAASILPSELGSSSSEDEADEVEEEEPKKEDDTKNEKEEESDQEESGDGSDEQEEEPNDEESNSDDLEDSYETEDESMEEEEGSQDDEKEVDPTKNDNKKDNKEQHALVPVVAETDKQVVGLRNSVSHKKEWDTFCREAKSKMPAQLNDLFLSSKKEVFNLWLDSGMDWKKRQLEAERKHQQRNVAMRGWKAIQGKELRKAYSQEKFDSLVKKRKEQGLFYEDEEFKGDDEDSQLLPLNLFHLGVKELLYQFVPECIEKEIPKHFRRKKWIGFHGIRKSPSKGPYTNFS